MQIQFIPATTPKPAAKYLAQTLIKHLGEGQKVLWLLSGGSGISTAAATAVLLVDRDLSNLTVSLIDERYGPVGFRDSNWQQLTEVGLNLPGATMHPVLNGAGHTETAENFAEFLDKAFLDANYRLGLLGVGPDGHTSGILPHSPAVTAPGLACAYTGHDYERVTTTPLALSKLNEAVLYVAGEPKWAVLDRLETDLPVAEQPAQALKAINKLTIFTDRPVR